MFYETDNIPHKYMKILIVPKNVDIPHKYMKILIVPKNVVVDMNNDLKNIIVQFFIFV